jgi:hypothetical protein
MVKFVWQKTELREAKQLSRKGKAQNQFFLLENKTSAFIVSP